MSVERAIARINDEHRTKLLELAKQWRSSVLLPLCRKHQMTYVAGNGDIFLSRGDENLGTADEAIRAGETTDVVDALAILNIEVSYNDHFGYYVDDVREADLIAPSRRQAKRRVYGR